MAFDKKRFKAQMKMMRITQKQLAERFDVDLRTISRWLDPKVTIKQEIVTNLCAAIGSLPTDFDETWEGPLDTKNVARVSARVSSAAKNGYWLLKKRYGVTETEICEIAPTLFALFASSLSKESNPRKILKEKAFGILAEQNGYIPTEEAFQAQNSDETFNEEVAELIEQGQIFGNVKIEEKYLQTTYQAGRHNPFAQELESYAKGSKMIKLGWNMTGECPKSRGVAIDVPATNEITNKDIDLNEAIAFGRIELFSSEFEILETDEDRIAWMKDQSQKWKKESEERDRELIKKFPELGKHVPVNNPTRQEMLKERLKEKWELT